MADPKRDEPSKTALDPDNKVRSDVFNLAWALADAAIRNVVHASEYAVLARALDSARREALEECAKTADALAAELDADALTCEAMPLAITYQAHEVLRLQQRQVSKCAAAIRALRERGGT